MNERSVGGKAYPWRAFSPKNSPRWRYRIGWSSLPLDVFFVTLTYRTTIFFFSKENQTTKIQQKRQYFPLTFSTNQNILFVCLYFIRTSGFASSNFRYMWEMIWPKVMDDWKGWSRARGSFSIRLKERVRGLIKGREGSRRVTDMV